MMVTSSRRGHGANGSVGANSTMVRVHATAMPTSILDFSKPHVLRNALEYEAAVTEIDALLDRGRLVREDEDRLEFLTLLVESYDDAHFPMGAGSTPQSVVDFLLEQNAMTRAELAPLMGGRSRVSDFFHGRRQLSLGQIRKLRERFGVSADALLEPTTGAD
jgi:HTH-type transcriptional regulator/antitoxin HigA